MDNKQKHTPTTIMTPLEPEDDHRLRAYLKKVGMKKGFFIRKAVLEKLEREDV